MACRSYTFKLHRNGLLHCEDGPAAEYNNGTKEWWIRGKRHRIDGPAIERASGRNEWFLNGVKLSKKEFDFKVNSGLVEKK